MAGVLQHLVPRELRSVWGSPTLSYQEDMDPGCVHCQQKYLTWEWDWWA